MAAIRTYERRTVDSEEYYQEGIRENVQECMSAKGGQPILFLGSGVSRRYFGAPDWRGLLKEMAARCAGVPREFAYYEQTYKDLPAIGQEFAVLYKEWAWSEGRSEFPTEYFGAPYPQEIFLKHKVAEYFRSITPAPPFTEDPIRGAELRQLQAVRPHAIITTNYDQFVERLFPEYEPIVGQRILTMDGAFFGEVFKIHGCVTRPETMVLTKTDYINFASKKKYLSAKLLAFFAEHPVLFVGYSAGDANIQAILSDIDIILAADGHLIPNIFLLRRPGTTTISQDRQREELIAVEDGRRVRINTIVADDFSWVFRAFSANNAIERIRPRLLRGLLARTYDLVRHDIPKRTVEVDYTILEKAVEEGGELAKLYGITVLSDATHVNISYPFSLTQIGKQLGYKGWHGAEKLLFLIKERTGFDLKANDNKYHVAVKAGQSTIFHKYSPQAVELLKRLANDPSVDLKLDELVTDSGRMG